MISEGKFSYAITGTNYILKYIIFIITVINTIIIV